jgi:hypothetical protein
MVVVVVVVVVEVALVVDVLHCNRLIGEDVAIEAESIHDIAGLIKTFLRELPTPLLTYEMYRSVLVCARDGGFADEDQFIEALKAVMARIPAVCLAAHSCSASNTWLWQ